MPAANCTAFRTRPPRKSKFFQPRITTVAIRAASTAKPGRNSWNGKERYRKQSAVNLDLFCGPLFAASKSLPNTYPPRPNNPCSSNYLQPVQSVTNIKQSFTTNISCIYLCMHDIHTIYLRILAFPLQRFDAKKAHRLIFGSSPLLIRSLTRSS